MRLFVVDRHPIAREGLRQIINSTNDLTIVGESDTCEGVATNIDECDLLVLDGELEAFEFLSTFSQNRKKGRPPFVLVISRHPEDQHAIQWIHTGANGYVTKSRPPNVILDAVRRVSTGGRYLSRELSEAILVNVDRMNRTTRLSRREHQVLCLLATGSPAAQIASQLSLSAKTISTYRARVLDKLNLRTTAALIRYALKEGLVD